jgi:hypothetical protein
MFIFLIFLAAFLMESIGTLISVIGITAFLGVNPITIGLAIIFDIAKLITVSFLYKEWNTAPKLLKKYMTLASIVLIIFTSIGASGYLSAEFQKGILPSKSIDIKVSSLEEEKNKLETRKVQIDNQISNLPADQVKGRAKLITNFKSETEHLNTRLIQIDEELPKLKMEAIDKNSHAGPITYLAKALNTSVESAMGYIIGLIIFVFDPLAIALILAGNYMVDKKSSKKESATEDFISDKVEESILVTELPKELPEVDVLIEDLYTGKTNQYEVEEEEAPKEELYRSSLENITDYHEKIEKDVYTNSKVY